MLARSDLPGSKWNNSDVLCGRQPRRIWSRSLLVNMPRWKQCLREDLVGHCCDPVDRRRASDSFVFLGGHWVLLFHSGTIGFAFKLSSAKKYARSLVPSC